MLTVKTLAETAGLVALAGALNLIKVFTLPQGGSITLAAMVPVLLLALRRGWKVGIVAGIVFGLVVLIEEPQGVYYPTQALLDYPIAFGALGLAGFFRKLPFLGVVVSIAGRFASHFISGVIFFANFAPAGTSPEVYSAIYNGSYLVPELFISTVVVQLLAYARALDLYI